MMKTLIVCGALLLAGCQKPQSPDAAVAIAVGSYEAAGKVALQYVTLPPCDPIGPKLCAEPKVKVQIQRASSVARGALDQALDVIADPTKLGTTREQAVTAAETAVKVFVLITDQYKL